MATLKGLLKFSVELLLFFKKYLDRNITSILRRLYRGLHYGSEDLSGARTDVTALFKQQRST